jgi:hypothetical protein
MTPDPQTAARSRGARETVVGVFLLAFAAFGGFAILQTGGAPSPSAAGPGAAASRGTPTPGQGISCETDARCVVASYLTADAPLSDTETRAIWDQRCCQFQYLIALVPDPVDAHVGWLFDPFVEAIQRAAEFGGYALDRFELPWGPEASAKAECASGSKGTAEGSQAPESHCQTLLVHEREPGVLVFRRATGTAARTGTCPVPKREWCSDPARVDGTQGAGAELLVVFLVGETPTGGIQKHAFAAALDRIAECADNSIAILGPSFSGSTESLAAAIGEWWLRNPSWQKRNMEWRQIQQYFTARDAEACALPQCVSAVDWCCAVLDAAKHELTPFRVISGSATSVPSDELEGVGATEDGAAVVAFSATVLPDRAVFRRFIGCYLRDRLGVKSDQIALLIEANTGYGQALGALGALSPTPAATPTAQVPVTPTPQSETAPTGAGVSCPTPTPPAVTCDESTVDGEILRLTFPMHLAGARSAWEKLKGVPPTPAVPSAAQPRLQLALEETREPPDLLPQMYPGMTGPSVELVLANILATIARKQIAYVGVLASDTRDKVFLVQQIHKYCPDVRVFTFESDLFYAHPDFQATMQGMLVASTYPLFTRTQPWTGKTWDKRLQFPNSAAQGIYNAMLALLGGDTAYLMIDYGPPVIDYGQQGGSISGKRVPSVWVSAVGNGGLWPLTQFPTDADNPYVFAQWLSWKPEDKSQSETGSVRSAKVVWLVLSLFCLFQVLRYAIAHALAYAGHAAPWPWAWWRRSVFFPHTRHRREQCAYTLLCFGTLSVLYVFQASFFYVRPEAIGGAGRVLIAGTTFLLLAVLLHATTMLVIPARQGRLGVPLCAAAAALVSGLTIVVLGTRAPAEWQTIYAFFRNLPAPAPEQLMLDYERVLNLESNLSPLLPATFVAGIWYLWGRCQLGRLWLIENASVPNPLSEAGGLPGAGFRQTQEQITDTLRRPVPRFPVWLVALLWLLPCVSLGLSFLPTFEGAVFDGVFEIAFFVGSFGIVLASAHVYSLWVQVRWLLDRLAVHPIAAAFDALPERLPRRMRDSLYAYLPSVGDQELVISRWASLAHKFTTATQEGLKEKLGPTTVDELAAGLGMNLRTAQVALMKALEGGRRTATPEHSQAIQGYLKGVSSMLAKALGQTWGSGGVPRPHSAKGEDAKNLKESSESDPLIAWLVAAEDFVAIQVVTYFGQVFRHVRNWLAFVTVGLLLLLLTVPSYPFQPQRLLNMFAWALVLLVVCGGLLVSVQMNRSEVLSRITGSTPNQLNFDRTLIRDVMVYGGVPLLSLIATQFPGIGQTLFFWIEPALRAVK